MGVLGMGGLFFRVRSPEAPTAWYREHLGVGGGCAAQDSPEPPNEWVWQALGGPMAFAPFKADSDYFAADKTFTLNFRVSDLDDMLEQLNAAGIAIITKPEWDEGGIGRFARIHDPEGNTIELWEPPQT